VLADALSYVQKHYAPSRIIDLATLTGGIIVAIGEEATGLFSTCDGLVSQLEKAADINCNLITCKLFAGRISAER